MSRLIKQQHYIQVFGAYTLETIKEYVRDVFEGKCLKDTGYFTAVEDVTVLETEAADKGHLKCKVEITARAFLPQVGARIKVRVEQYIKDRGSSLCCASELEKIKLLVKSPPTLPGDELNVKITMVRFQNGNYRFLGDLE